MSVILESDSRPLVYGQKYSYTTTNYASGVSAFSILNATDSVFATDAFLLLGNFGAEDAEIVKIATVDNDTGAITTATATLFAHSESTRVTILPYDKVRFYYTTTTTYDTDTPLTSYIDLQPNSWFSTYSDEDHSTGYGWFIFQNSVTSKYSDNSNAIPYAGFDSDTTESILDDFFSLLSNNELKLVSRDDALSWLSEGYSKLRNKLNLTNTEFTASEITALSVLTGTTEYDLPSDFFSLISLTSGLDTSVPGEWGGDKRDIEFIPLVDAYSYSGDSVRYYIRGKKIGILPTPESDTTYHYLYNTTASRLSLNTDEVDLPDGGSYVVKDFALYRANQKARNFPAAKQYLDSFNEGSNEMIIMSIKRNAGKASWGIDDTACV